MVSNAAFAPNTNQFVMTVSGRDPMGDARRLAALVQSLYRENQRLADDSADARRAYVESNNAVDAIEAQIAQIMPALHEEQSATGQLQSAEEAVERNTTRAPLSCRRTTTRPASCMRPRRR